MGKQYIKDSLKGIYKIVPTKEDIERLKQEILGIYRYLYDKMDNEDFRKIIQKNKILESKMIKNKSPEAFTQEKVVKRILTNALGYSSEDIEPSEVMGITKNTTKETDILLMVENEKILVEVEPLNKQWEMGKKDIIDLPHSNRTKKDNLKGMEQVYMWLNYRDNGGKYGIATNGFVWQKAMLIQECKKYERGSKVKEQIKIFDPINLKDIFKSIEYEKGFSNIEDEEMGRIEERLKKFYAEFSKELIISHFEAEAMKREIWEPD